MLLASFSARAGALSSLVRATAATSFQTPAAPAHPDRFNRYAWFRDFDPLVPVVGCYMW